MSTVLDQKSNEAPAAACCESRVQRYARPVVDISETPEAYLLKADLPGVGKAGVEISVENNTLTITGRRTPAEVARQRVYGETGSGVEYRRVFELDPTIHTADVSASMDNGVLTVTLPKAERVKSRKVPVSD